MSNYSIVPNAALTATADAIRTKSGSQATIEFDHDTGFADAVDAIDGLAEWLTGELNVVDLSGITSVTRTLRSLTSSFTFYAPDLTALPSYMFHQSSGLTSITCPKVTSFGTQSLYNTRITILIAPSATSFPANFSNASSTLKTVDAGQACSSLGGSCFNGTGIDLLILRRTSGLVSLANTNVFGGTPFASGGAGGTIYIPKVLYDHLGDGTSLDYKAATNWSTIEGYGTITWAKIEGSQYENYYADGTPIPTT